jgi:hypothetical protein
VRIAFGEFISFYSIPLGLGIIIYYLVLKKGHLRPRKVKFISWENALFELARWPWVLVACVDGVVSAVFRRSLSYKVTAKSKAFSVYLPLKVMLPYLIVVYFSLFAIAWGSKDYTLRGYLWFDMFIACSYTLLSLAVLILHFKEIGRVAGLRLAIDHLPHIIFPVGAIAVMLIIIFVKPHTPIQAGHPAPEQLQIKIPDVETKISVLQSEVEKDQSAEFVEHRVVNGESLWRIARKYYGRGAEWTKIKTSNGSRVIHAGEILRIIKSD